MTTDTALWVIIIIAFSLQFIFDCMLFRLTKINRDSIIDNRETINYLDEKI